MSAKVAEIDNASADQALGRLSRLPTIAGDRQAPYARTASVFGRPATGIALPLNRKTTQQSIMSMPLADLEPRQPLVSVHGLQSYIVRPRRDPPDVVRVVMRDGRTRMLIQEGHTRLGAAVLRGDTEMPMRVWDFTQTDTGGFEPVVRGRQRIYERIRDRPYAERLQHLSTIINLPNIADVSFPSMVGAIPSKPPTKKKRKRVQYKGVSLSRQPMAFEVKVLSLTEIPPRLDAAVLSLEDADATLPVILNDVAQFGVQQALLELVRQGAPESILSTPPMCEEAVRGLAAQIEADRVRDLRRTFDEHTASVGRRHLRETRALALARELTGRWAPAILKRHAKRGVNMAFALGRAAVIAHYRRPRIDLAKTYEPVGPPYHDDEGKFQSKMGALADGNIWVDKVIHTAVMDTNTCDECAEVDGEEMELGDDRQQELHPPYIKCLGGDRCRCVQIALLSDGSEVEVDEVPDEAYDEDD